MDLDYIVIVGSMGITIIAIYFLYYIFKNSSIKAAEKSGDITICPKCGGLDRSPSTTSIFIGYSPVIKYKCNNCKYEGIFPLVNKNEIESFRKDLKRSKENSS